MPTPSPSPQAPAPTALPNLPDYHTAAAPATAATTGSSSADIWGLGDLYGQPVYLGYEPLSQRAPLSEYGVQPLPTPQHNEYGTTQQIMKQAMKLWSEQAEERKKNGGGLTGFEQLQQQLWYAGAYGQTSLDSIHVGQWTSQTADALSNALGSYEQALNSKTPITFADFLKQNAAAAQSGVGGENSAGGNGGGGGGSSSSGPSQVSVSDPAQIRAAAQSAAQAALGRGLSSSELDLFVNQFQAQQTQAETSTDGTVSAPDLSAQAMQFAQQENPQAYTNEKASGYVNALYNLFLPSESQRPSMTPVPSA